MKYLQQLIRSDSFSKNVSETQIYHLCQSTSKCKHMNWTSLLFEFQNALSGDQILISIAMRNYYKTMKSYENHGEQSKFG
jgi:hypothetical protein